MTEETGHWTVIEVNPFEVKQGINVRKYNPDHVARLAESMSEQGQLQECIGDTNRTTGRYRVWAGLHRLEAAKVICQTRSDFKLRIRIWSEEFTPDEILSIQIAENLHEAMSHPELAYAIQKVYDCWTQTLGEPSIAQLARKIGRGYDQVRGALRYVGLDERIRYLVEMEKENERETDKTKKKKEGLLYSLAIELASLPKERQFQIAIHIVLHNLKPQTARLLIRNTLTEGTPYPGMFSGQEFVEWQEGQFRLAFKDAADKAAQDAAGYFERILFLLERCLKKGERIEATETVRDILVSFIKSSSRFVDLIREYDQEFADSLVRQASDVKVKDPV